MRWLVLAPVGLPTVPEEAQEVINILSRAGDSVHVEQGEVTMADLLDALDDGPYDAWWIGTHAGADGFVLSSGVLRPTRLGHLLAESQATMVVLNACFSAAHVDAIQRVAPAVEAVATIDPEGVADSTAWEQAVLLARAFARLRSLPAACRAVAGDTQYRFFPAVNISMATTEHELEATVAQLVRALQGDPFSRQPGMIDMLDALRAEMSSYIQQDAAWKRATEARIEALEARDKWPSRETWLGLSGLLLGVLVLLFMLTGGWM